ELVPAARTEARRALEQDPSLAKGHRALAWASFVIDWDWAGADREFQAALRGEPKTLEVQSETLEWYGHFLISVGRTTEGVDALARALQLNPRSPTVRGYYIDALRAARRYDDAVHEARLENSAQIARHGELYEISDLFFDQGRFE